MIKQIIKNSSFKHYKFNDSDYYETTGIDYETFKDLRDLLYKTTLRLTPQEILEYRYDPEHKAIVRIWDRTNTSAWLVEDIPPYEVSIEFMQEEDFQEYIQTIMVGKKD